jgi:hypothetical protein
MARDRETRTYHVRQLPAHLDTHGVAKLLAGLDDRMGSLENIHIFSVAASLNPAENPPRKTLTIIFGVVPRVFDNDRDEWHPALHKGNHLRYAFHWFHSFERGRPEFALS